MRKKEKQIDKREEIEEIIEQAEICRLGLCSKNIPYIVPMVFGYKNNNLYFHTGKRGKKIDILKENNNACFEIEIDVEIVDAEKACNWAVNYSSVIGTGKASILDDIEEKREALDIIMKHYSNKNTFKYPDEILEKTAVIKLVIDEITGKSSKI